MTGEVYYFLGTIVKAYGIRGELVLSLKKYLFEIVMNLETVFIDIDGQQVPFFINSRKPAEPDSMIIKLDSIDTLEDARQLVNCKLYTSSEYPLPENVREIDLHSFIGFTLYGEMEGKIGKVENVFMYPENPVFQIIDQGREVLIPINKDLVKSIDPARKLIEMKLPDGLINLSE
ncbi:MAG: 16S rRNA processing protein RimM [Bacteroidales bacterium]|nr:MAG: 16S rRNA processing protein RimM [Bacteroidales bacterium]